MKQQIAMLYSRIWNLTFMDEKNRPTFKADRKSKLTLFCFMNVSFTYNSVKGMCIKLKILMYNFKTGWNKKAFLQEPY